MTVRFAAARRAGVCTINEVVRRRGSQGGRRQEGQGECTLRVSNCALCIT